MNENKLMRAYFEYLRDQPPPSPYVPVFPETITYHAKECQAILNCSGEVHEPHTLNQMGPCYHGRKHECICGGATYVRQQP